MLIYKIEPIEKNYWLLFKLLNANEMNLNEEVDMGSDIALRFNYMEYNDGEAEWYVGEMDIDNPQINEISNVALMILEELKEHDFTSNVKSIIDFAEENVKASHDSNLFSYKLIELENAMK